MSKIETTKTQFKRALYENDINAFIEAFWRNEKGERVRQAEHHKVIQAHIDWCLEHGQHALILAPWGHAKTEQTLARVLFWMVRNREIRIKIISDIAGNAIQRLKALQRYISSDDFQQYFPDIQPMGGFQKPVQWAGNKILIDRKSHGKDATVEAWGVHSSGIGTRAEILVIDDPVGESAIFSDADREAVKSAVRNTWFSRLVDNGFVCYIATIWHEQDLTSELELNERFSVCKIAVADDMQSLDVSWQRIDESHPYYGLERLPLWELNDHEFLVKKKQEIGEQQFSRGYQHNPLTPGALTFPSFSKTLTNDIPHDYMTWPMYGGVDFSSTAKLGNVMFTLAVGHIPVKGQVIIPVDVVRSDDSGPGFARIIADKYMTYKHRIICVETNAVQESLLTWLRTWQDLPAMPLKGYQTGAQKHSYEVGLPSIEIEFQNGLWLIPRKNHDISCRCDYCVWQDSMRKYPQSKEDDTVMAMWLAREASRQAENYPRCRRLGV